MDSVTHFHAKNRAYIFLKSKHSIYLKKKGGGGEGGSHLPQGGTASLT